MRLNGGKQAKGRRRRLRRKREEAWKGKEARRIYRAPVIQPRVEKKEEEGRGEETRILIYRRGVSIIISPSLSSTRGQDRVPGLSAPFRLPWSYRVRIYFALCPSGAPLNGRVFRLCPPRLIQPTRRVAATDTTTHALSVCLPIADRPRGALHRQIVALRRLRSQRSADGATNRQPFDRATRLRSAIASHWRIFTRIEKVLSVYRIP